MVPITSEDGCLAAAKALDLWRQRSNQKKNIVVLNGNPHPVPEGCYWYSDDRTNKAVVLANHPDHKGGGSETSTARDNRHPICASGGTSCVRACVRVRV